MVVERLILAMLANGNVLMVAWERKTSDDAIAAGRRHAPSPRTAATPTAFPAGSAAARSGLRRRKSRTSARLG